MQIKMIVINLRLPVSFFLNCGLWVGGFAMREIFCCILVFCLSTLIFQCHISVRMPAIEMKRWYSLISATDVYWTSTMSQVLCWAHCLKNALDIQTCQLQYGAYLLLFQAERRQLWWLSQTGMLHGGWGVSCAKKHRHLLGQEDYPRHRQECVQSCELRLVRTIVWAHLVRLGSGRETGVKEWRSQGVAQAPLGRALYGVFMSIGSNL